MTCISRASALPALRSAASARPGAVSAGLWLRFAARVDRLREAINNRIHAVLPGDRGSIASALITGKRNAISAPVSDAFYISSLAHVLAISGYHMAVVAGIVFFFIRAGLALIPSLASRYPIKKWAAAGALFTAAFYLVLSGASISTQRAFIMIAILLVGVMVDRPTLTFRTISVAAFGVLLLTPEAIVHPSFQMSFAATLALIAGYQYGLPWRAKPDTSLGARAALWGGREIAGLIAVSLLAGFATTPYAAYHFHRVAPYGVLANLLAMPVVSVWVMPMGILGVLTLPFGFDAMFWQLMGQGIDWMITVVLWVTSLPGAVGHIRAFGSGPLLLGTAGLAAAVSAAHAVALERGSAGHRRFDLGGDDAAPRRAGLRRRADRGAARPRRTAFGAACAPRHLRAQGVAESGRRRPRRGRREPAQRRPVRFCWLHWAP